VRTPAEKILLLHLVLMMGDVNCECQAQQHRVLSNIVTSYLTLYGVTAGAPVPPPLITHASRPPTVVNPIHRVQVTQQLQQPWSLVCNVIKTLHSDVTRDCGDISRNAGARQSK